MNQISELKLSNIAFIEQMNKINEKICQFYTHGLNIENIEKFNQDICFSRTQKA